MERELNCFQFNFLYPTSYINTRKEITYPYPFLSDLITLQNPLDYQSTNMPFIKLNNKLILHTTILLPWAAQFLKVYPQIRQTPESYSA